MTKPTPHPLATRIQQPQQTQRPAQGRTRAAFAASLSALVISMAGMLSAPSFTAMASGAATAVATVAALTAPGVAMAATKDIPGIGISVHKRPGGSSARSKSTTTGPDGVFVFRGLEAGEYDVIFSDGSKVQTTVGKDGYMKGEVTSDGKTGQVQFYNERGIKDNAIKNCGKCGVTAG